MHKIENLFLLSLQTGGEMENEQIIPQISISEQIVLDDVKERIGQWQRIALEVGERRSGKAPVWRSLLT